MTDQPEDSTAPASEVWVFAEESPEENESRTVRELSSMNPRLGFHPSVPTKLLKAHEFTLSIPSHQLTDIVVNKRMIVTEIGESNRKQPLDFGDWITHVNGTLIRSTTQFTSLIADLRKKSGEVEVKFKVRRTIKCYRISNPKYSKHIPAGYDLVPGFRYLHAFLVMYPEAKLGLKIKIYDDKIYVLQTNNGWKSLAVRTLLVGDVIIKVDETIPTTVVQASELMLKGLTTKKYVHLIIERPETTTGIRRVRHALTTERQFEINPRLADDVVEICKNQRTRMNKNPDEEPKEGIYKPKEGPFFGVITSDELKSVVETDIDETTTKSTAQQSSVATLAAESTPLDDVSTPPSTPVAKSPKPFTPANGPVLLKSIRFTGPKKNIFDKANTVRLKSAKIKKSVTLSDKKEETEIGMEPVNPLFLQKVPSQEENSLRTKRKLERKRLKEQEAASSGQNDEETTNPLEKKTAETSSGNESSGQPSSSATSDAKVPVVTTPRLVEQQANEKMSKKTKTRKSSSKLKPN
ncbi:hypothetical protein M3Y95_00337600 [Aphelenchoides besseyi]|nr:hypothetical protein M3Y95_00337600 [Aphelenchoides besseyi]